MSAKAEKPKIIIICGPTGVGKTAVAVVLAQHFHGQIIGADSMQVYKYMDIGTAKPTVEEQACMDCSMQMFLIRAFVKD
jgi:tRNA dimethylallyltransferase